MNLRNHALIVTACCSLFVLNPASAHAQGTAFTYQGQLQSGTNAANGTFDVQFTLFSVSSGGSSVAGPVVKTGLAVTNGLFTTTVDFNGAFTGASNWLELAVRTNGAPSFSSPLVPRQQLTPTPYAIFAESANATNLVGTVQSANLSGVALLGTTNTFAADQTVLGQVIASGSFGAMTLLDRFHPVSDFGWQWRADNTGLNAARFNGGAGAQFFTISTNGLVGIGTSTPATALQVNGTVTATSFSGDGSGLTNVSAANVPGVALLSGGNTFTGNQSVTSGTFGIGTTSPQATLEVRNTGNRNLILSGPGGGELSFFDTASSSQWDIFGATNGYAISRSGIDFPFFISKATGNIGIGTTTPQHKLDVDGNIFLGTQRSGAVFSEIGDTLYLGAEQKYLGNSLLSSVGGSTDWINLMANPGSAGIMFGLAGPTTANPHTNITSLMVIKPNGNVGIGTNTPSSALQVNGTVTATGFSGDGTGLTNVAVLNKANTFTTQETFLVNAGYYGCLVTDGTDKLGAFIGSGQCSYGTVSAHGLGFFVNNGFDSMFLDLNGHLGIGTSTPNTDSSLQVKGMVRMGSETGTSEAPNKSVLVRRINSTSKAAGQVVARGTAGTGGVTMTLERDGSNGGLILKLSAVAAAPQIVGLGITASGATVNISTLPGSTSTQIFTDSQRIAYCRLTFGDGLNEGDTTTVELMRYVDASVNNDLKWIGTVTSTVNQ